MEDKTLNLEEVNLEEVEETGHVDDAEEIVEAPLYLVVEEDGKVVDLSFEDGVFYQNVSENIDIELVKSELGIGENLYWDGYLYVKEVDWKEENDKLKSDIHGLKQLVADGKRENEKMLLDHSQENELLTKKISVLSEQLDFRDDLIQELALMVFQ